MGIWGKREGWKESGRGYGGGTFEAGHVFVCISAFEEV
jgi:hypothetical protein